MPFIESLTLVFFCLFVTLILPRLKTGKGSILTMGLLACYSFSIGSRYPFTDIWLSVFLPIAILVIGYAVVIGGRTLTEKRTKENVVSDSSETERTLGLFYQQQGMLDLAFEKFRMLGYDEDVKDMLYSLGLEYEKKDQLQKALVVFKMILGGDKYPEDLDISIFQSEETETSKLIGAQINSNSDVPEKTESKPAIGGYEISGDIGRDSMGVVFKAYDPKSNIAIALKSVKLSRFDKDHIEEIRGRFFREAECLPLLTHPNIVEVYNWGEEQDQFYIAMEYLDGEKLVKYTRKENLLSVRETLRIIGRVADALDFAHGKDIIHQYIRPDSIIRMKKALDTKVIDFGIAWIPSAFEDKPDSVEETHFYMSPEQIAGKKVDGRSDIFSLGVVLFEMLTGEKPFSGEDMTSLMLKISKEKHPSPRTLNSKVPRVIEQIIDRALEKDLEKRYQTAGQMASHLNMVATRIDELIALKMSGPE